MSETAAPRRAKGTANREAITAAAAELFWRDGYASTTLAEVSVKANIPPGNLFYYFKTKADLERDEEKCEAVFRPHPALSL